MRVCHAEYHLWRVCVYVCVPANGVCICVCERMGGTHHQLKERKIGRRERLCKPLVERGMIERLQERLTRDFAECATVIVDIAILRRCAAVKACSKGICRDRK